MTPINTVILLAAPTYMAKLAYSPNIEKRIENMWRTHKNRVDQGLGGTFNPTGFHESMKQDTNMRIPFVNVHVDLLTDGVIMDQRIDNPFVRWH